MENQRLEPVESLPINRNTRDVGVGGVSKGDGWFVEDGEKDEG